MNTSSLFTVALIAFAGFMTIQLVSPYVIQPFFDIGFGCPKSALSCSQQCRENNTHSGGYCNGPFNIVCSCY
ncbi:defensin, putative [Ixodes scapularis]|uniref:Defensin, putative n=1 Tax=Ixodes scapularis TaxID=6945 RepID=B7QGE4_IXOSC|nr:defensin, putative [Ixodes scapularis]|eukprot:XP_002401521.1 defensin, putative [Ixodes scapularis]